MFGATRATELFSLTGLAAAGGKVFVHDAKDSRVLVLDDRLEVLSHFGRRGNGPGEFAVPAMLAFDPVAHYTTNTLAADDSTVYVYDGRRLQYYSHDGRYIDRGRATGPVAGREHGMRRLESWRSELYFGYDSLDFATGRRQLQTWRWGATGRVLVHAVDLAAVSIRNGRVSSHSRDPRPVWAVAGGCIVWSDGLNHRLVRIRLLDGATDTVSLPAHRVPPDDYDHARVSRLYRAMGSPPPPRRPRNPPLWHWAGLIADPDGHVWVRPWTRLNRMEGPVYRVDPWGRVHAEHIAAFPEAFGPPGVFYARDRNWETDELLLVRFHKSM